MPRLKNLITENHFPLVYNFELPVESWPHNFQHFDCYTQWLHVVAWSPVFTELRTACWGWPILLFGMFSLYSNSKGSDAAMWVRRHVQAFAGRICYKNCHLRAGSYLLPLAAAHLWVMSLEKKKTNENTFVYLSQARLSILADGESYQHLSQNRTNQQFFLCLAKPNQISLGILPVWPAALSQISAWNENSDQQVAFPDESESSLGALLFCWFCHMAHFIIVPQTTHWAHVAKAMIRMLGCSGWRYCVRASFTWFCYALARFIKKQRDQHRVP